MSAKAHSNGKAHKPAVVHYLYRGGIGSDMRSECGKDMETPNAKYSTNREKATCRKCLRASLALPERGGDPEQMIRRFHVELEVDCRDGTIHARSKDRGICVLRLVGVPMQAMRALASTPADFVPQLDVTIRDNMPAHAGVANLALAAPPPETRKMPKRKGTPATKPVPKIRWRVYADGEFVGYSDQPTEKKAINELRRDHGLDKGVIVEARLSIRR